VNPQVREMRRRAVFLDVDGTYANRGWVPPEHVQAVRAARANGHLVLLCTGRALPALSPELLSAGFDGVVTSAGAYVLLGERVLADVRFPAPLAERLVRVLQNHGAGFVVESPDALYAGPDVADRLQALHRKVGGPASVRRSQDGPQDLLAGLVLTEDLGTVSFAKVTCFESPVPLTAIVGEVGQEVAVVPSSIPHLADSAGELYLAGLTKAHGIELVAAELGMAAEDVVGVGDGFNDLEMLRYAGVGVAIEGAPQEVLAAADRTTPGPHGRGVALLFAELGLVGEDRR